MTSLPQTAPTGQLAPACVECRIAAADRELRDTRARLSDNDPYANPKAYDRLNEIEQGLLKLLGSLRTLAGLTTERCEEHAK